MTEEEWLKKWSAQLPERDEEWYKELLTIYGYKVIQPNGPGNGLMILEGEEVEE